jgi:uncharacterized protein involved in exopolysaccharide biosynthesis
VIQVTYSASNAKYAAAVANAFAKAYMEVTLNLRVEPTKEAAAWFDEQLTGPSQGVRRLADEARQRSSARRGITATDERVDVETARLAELSSQALRATESRYEASARMGQANGRTATENVPEVLASPLVTSLKTEMLRAESKLQELSTRLGPNHPQYQQQASEVRPCATAITPRCAPSSAACAASPRRPRPAKARSRPTSPRSGSASRTCATPATRRSVLQQDVETSKKAYEAALARRMVNKVESGARQTNVTVLNPAIEPTFPMRPRVPLNIALGFFVGTLLGSPPCSSSRSSTAACARIRTSTPS